MIIYKTLSNSLKWINLYSSKRNLISLQSLLICILLISFSCKPVVSDTGEKLLLNLYYQSKSNVQYNTPSIEHFEKARHLFKQMLYQPVEISNIENLWSELGYKLHEIDFKGEKLLVLSPDAQQTEAYGFFIFRINSNMPLIIQSPHRFFDLHTGKIAMQFFLESRAKACAWNTVHRRNVDFGKEKTSFFHALTLASIDTDQDISVIQLHGYGQKRNSEPLVDDVILSNGVFKPSAKLYEISNCLSKYQDIDVAVFPIHVSQLGGTRNVASKAFKQSSLHNFFHIEMSKTYRERLRDKKDLRNAFLSCFIN